MAIPRNTSDPTREERFLSHVHHKPEQGLNDIFDVPAHIHHVAYHMANPPIERSQSQDEFRYVLQCLNIANDNAVVEEKLGYGVRMEQNGDRLMVVWEAHTEYYTYQIWHIISDAHMAPAFGSIVFPEYHFPLCPLGAQITSLDIIIAPHQEYTSDQIRQLIPGQSLYGGRMCRDDIFTVTSFVKDENQRERYLVFSPSAHSLQQNLGQLINGITTLANYTHLILRPLSMFSQAIDEVHAFERHHLTQKGKISEQLSTSTSNTLDLWMTELTDDYVEVGRLAEAMRYQLSAAVPYESIIRVTIQAIDEQSFWPFRPISEYVLGRITGVADGYQQLLRRIDAMHAAIEGTIAIIRARIELLLERQNLTLLTSVDQTTKRQAILQRTVEGLSFIVISYYITSLANYIFEAFQAIGWIDNATLATGLFVPVAFLFSLGLTVLGHNAITKIIHPERKKY